MPWDRTGLPGAYMPDPNYLKTAAPKFAAAIRAAVNGHPVLSKFIPFNTVAPLGAGLLPASGALAEPNPTTPGAMPCTLPSP